MRRSNRMKEIMRDVHDRIDAELHTVGLQRFGAAIAHRMELIEVLAARFNNDSRTIRRICLEVLDRIATVDPELQSKLDADSRRDMSIAAYLHDIGKSGPFDAPQATQEAIVKLYAVENVADPRSDDCRDGAHELLFRGRREHTRASWLMRPAFTRHHARILGSPWLLDARHSRS